ncbi:RNA helicase [Malassezia vespertilionis]|uniref:RNA helicase n=1 Tax=Malassezia vespertilionis TaxID=2020962 RepID=UPI0024B1FBA0|nr:RNA helicase [Malassezia vespertilionis]WFD08485.1 RNA helicase [Malassezia vespertilionis]
MAFWKPGVGRPGTLTTRLIAASALDRASVRESDASIDVSAAFAPPSAELKSRLPVAKHRNALLYLVEQHGVVIVVGHTGSGKTTQIPQYLLEAGWAADGRQIVCTQPRRVAATSVAARVAQEMGVRVGEEVGYAVRFENCTDPQRTRLKYVTPGLLFRECMQDPLLSRYSVVMVDEAHERGVYTDLLIAVLKKIQRKRPALRILLSSATLDAEAFARYFDPDYDGANTENVSIVSIEGQTFPVEVAYTEEPVQDYIAAAVDSVWSLHIHEPPGDVLVFLTGREEIEQVIQALADRAASNPKGLPMHLLPLCGGLSSAEQNAVFMPAPRGTRKVVVSTNVAESSVTIDGIVYVVDCGYTKEKQLDPSSGMDILSVVPASQAALAQRAGRAGRTRPGKCLRLFPVSALSSLRTTTVPELVRTDPAPYLLQLKALGIDNVARFDFVPPAPNAEAMATALTYLASLQALDSFGRLQPLGERIAEAPLDPMMARALLYAAHTGCAEEMLTIAAMSSVDTPFTAYLNGPAIDVAAEIERRKFVAEEGDQLTLLNVYNAFVHPRIGRASPKWAAKHGLSYNTLRRAQTIRAQLHKYATLHWHLPMQSRTEPDVLLKCLVAGYFKNAAVRMDDGSYKAVLHGVPLHAHPSSVLFTRASPSRYVLYQEVTHTTKAMIRDIAVIEQAWLLEIAPHYYELHRPALRY